jgi:hypothetical protein
MDDLETLFVGRSITSARDLREVFRKIWTGERPHDRFLTTFAEALTVADADNFYTLAPAALMLIERYPILATYVHHEVQPVEGEAFEEDGFSGLRIEPHLTTPSAKVCVWYRDGKWCATIFANSSQGTMSVVHEEGVRIAVLKHGEGVEAVR